MEKYHDYCHLKPLGPPRPLSRTSCHSYQKNHDECFVDTHTVAGFGENLTGNIPIEIPIPENGVDVTVFEDYTNNHNKTILQLKSIPAGNQRIPVPLEVTIERRGDCPIIATVPGGDFEGGTRIFQVEDFESLTVRTTGEFDGRLQAFIQKTFCICCPGQKKKYY